MKLHSETSSKSTSHICKKVSFVLISFVRSLRAVILEIVCRYLYYKWQYEGSTTEIPEFKVDPEVVLETLMTADFLEC
jgi:hypothetical protein